MTKVKNTLSRLAKDEDGGELLEYALIAGLIVIAAIAAMKIFNTAIKAKFTSVGTQIETATPN